VSKKTDLLLARTVGAQFEVNFAIFDALVAASESIRVEDREKFLDAIQQVNNAQGRLLEAFKSLTEGLEEDQHGPATSGS
jgi:hypothetical protein